MQIGAHVSMSHGLIAALDYAQSVGCECMQLFAKSPRRWDAAPVDPSDARDFIEQRLVRQTGPVFTHTAYLINLTTTDDELRSRSIRALADELVRAGLLGADGVVSHVGNDPGEDPVAASVRGAEAIRQAFEAAGESAHQVRLLVENTAGAGRSYGGEIRELASLIERTGLGPRSLGLCLDTCHAFAFGYKLDTQEGWSALIDEIEESIGLDRMGLIHANDCMFERGSKRDRHAWIGEGGVGTKGFAAMLCEPRITQVPAVTEMPGEVPDKDAINISRLRALRDECAPSH